MNSTSVSTSATPETPRTLKRVLVYCGANLGNDPRFKEAAIDIGRTLAARGIGLVYGGGGVGLMGVVANAALDAGGEVIGVIPEALKALEVEHRGITEMHVVPDMHSRKAMMLGLSDAVIALPGGFGTMDELFEALTWSQIGYHRKLCGLLNVAGYYDHLIRWLEHSVACGLVRDVNLQLLVHGNEVNAMLDALSTTPFPFARKWISPTELDLKV
jgi:uncharacterized protein (TIGR00730 family)